MMPKLLEFIIDLFLQKWRKGFCLFEPKYSWTFSQKLIIETYA
jgi:hypothetical protein